MSHDDALLLAQCAGLLIGWALIAGGVVSWRLHKRWHHKSYCAGMKAAARMLNGLEVLKPGGWHRPHLN